MTIDDRLASYVRARYDALVGDAALLCADPRDAEPVVAAMLARLMARPRWLPRRRRGAEASEDLDAVVRRRLVRACIADDRRRRRDARGAASDIRVMEVVAAAGPVQSEASNHVRLALGRLPARQRAALVMCQLDAARGVADSADRDVADGSRDTSAARDERVAAVLGWPVAVVVREAQAGLAALEDVLGVDPVGTATGAGTSRTEVLLRRAIEAAAAPATPRADPVPAVMRRARGMQRRRVVATAAAVAVVIIAGAQALGGGSDSVVTPVSPVAAAVPPSPPRALTHEATAYPSGAVTGGGYLWTIELHPAARHAGTSVERRDLRTGQVERTYRVPGEDFGIGYGLDRVWTWGAAVSRSLASDVSTIDPVTAAVRTVALGAGQVSDVAFAAGRAWFSQGSRNRVVALAPGLDLGKASYPANGVSDVAADGPDSVVALGGAGALVELPAGIALNRDDPSLTYLSGTSDYGVWIGHGGELTYSPALHSPLTLSLRLPLRVAYVVGSPQTGVYVATTSMNPLHYDPYLAYYSPLALRAAHPRPTLELSGAVKVDSMTADDEGGVVFVTTDGVIARWNPSAHRMMTGAAALAGTMR